MTEQNREIPSVIWNNRLWRVTSPYQVQGSKVGDPEDWLDTSDMGRVIFDIYPQEGDSIVGLFPTRNALFIFNQKRIHRLVPIDPHRSACLATNLNVEVYEEASEGIPHTW